MSDNAQTPPTAEELAAWEQITAAATPGEWRAGRLGDRNMVFRHEPDKRWDHPVTEYIRASDAAFIALARTAMPRLIAALTAERERLDWMQRHYVGADFAHGSPDGEISVMLIQLPEGARFTGDLRVDIDAARTPEGQ